MHSSQWVGSFPETEVRAWLGVGEAVVVLPLAAAACLGRTPAGRVGGCSGPFRWTVGGAAAGPACSVRREGQHWGQVVVGEAVEWAGSSGQEGMWRCVWEEGDRSSPARA